ncbi:TPA: DUF4189 domain-containing protein [Stenotrophomonas maltophilia]|nr:DUF4189 domain-containing protein [Stenotrophomonas maltophilia]TGW19262.1 DUF4189 domain-containing protein [Stenotrophomonas maltophilia]HEL3783342.1 DUF4189 domain-containing protein [Stenotrophomonas maltophilia]
MRALNAVILLAIAGLWSNSARAEGNCPPGFYPIGGQGVQGCAPIPGASAGASVDAPAAPAGEWMTRWGAIAESGSSTLVGTSMGQSSKLDAERQAITRCQAEGAKDCRVSISYYNQCVAYVVPSSGRGKGSITSAVDKSTAIALAKEKCTDAQGGACAVAYSECSLPEFQNF